jgi:ribosome maturation factor RimP
MDRRELITEIRSIIEDYLNAQNIQLVDLIYRYEGQDLFLMILADKPEGGITLDDCVYLNNRISRILDEKNIIEPRYILEVSSPGLDRPLVTKSDFLRCLDRNARFFLRRQINGKWELEGKIKSAKDDSVDIEIKGQPLTIPLSNIAKAKQVIDITG